MVTAWWSWYSPGVAEIEVVTVWRRLAWAQRGRDRGGHSMARSAWARRIPMGLFDFFSINFCLLGLDELDFGFLWIGILDFDGV